MAKTMPIKKRIWQNPILILLKILSKLATELSPLIWVSTETSSDHHGQWRTTTCFLLNWRVSSGHLLQAAAGASSPSLPEWRFLVSSLCIKEKPQHGICVYWSSGWGGDGVGCSRLQAWQNTVRNTLLKKGWAPGEGMQRALPEQITPRVLRHGHWMYKGRCLSGFLLCWHLLVMSGSGSRTSGSW